MLARFGLWDKFSAMPRSIDPHECLMWLRCRWKRCMAARPVRFVRAIASRLWASASWSLSAAVAFRLLFALFPFLFFLVGLARLFIAPDSLDLLLHELSRIAPAEVVDLLRQRLRALVESRAPRLLTVSAFLTVLSASSGVRALQRALDQIFGLSQTRSWWRAHLLSVAVTVGLAGFVLVATLLAIVAPIFFDWIDLGALSALAHALSLPLAGLFIALAFGILLRVLPDRRRHTVLLSPGAILAVAAWMALSWGFSVYVQNFGRYELTYGALGGAVIFLAWLKLSVDAFLLGAALDAERGGFPQVAARAGEVSSHR